MLDVLKWLLTAEGVGLAAFPFAYAAFPTLSDRGWGVAKPLGLLAAGLGVWALSYSGVLTNTVWAWWLIVGVMGIIGWSSLMRRRPELRAFFRDNWRSVIVGEALFIFFFAAWTAYRSFDPSASGTEKPMDYMILNSSYQTAAAPPEDAWLSGHPVSYYYYGYWMFAGMAKLSAVPVSVAFNLSIALVAAMSGGAIFSLVHSLVRNTGGSVKSGFLAGIAGAGLLLATASLAGWWEMLANFRAGGEGLYNWLAIQDLHRADEIGSWRPDSFWWWWRSSRVINSFDASGAGVDFTIQEFPFFSLLLGDLHPHLMSIPFVLTGMVAVYTLLVSKAKWGFGWIAAMPWTTAALVLLVGAAGFINAWDIAFLGALLFGAVTLKVHRERNGSIIISAIKGMPALILITAAGIATFSAFYFGTFESQVRSPIVGPAEFGTRPIHFFTVWGLLLLVSVPTLAGMALPAVRPYWGVARKFWSEGRLLKDRPALQPVLLVFAGIALPYLTWSVTHLRYNDLARSGDEISRLFSTLPLMIAVIILFVALTARARAGAPDAEQFVLLAGLLAVYLLFGAELFYVDDLFGNRMNTVFKFYYQAWIILSMVGGYGTYWWWRAHSKFSGRVMAASRTAAVLAFVLLLGALYYPVAAIFSKPDFKASPTLDALAYVKRAYPEEAAGIAKLISESKAGERIVEAVGGSYTDFGRISGSTGLATVLGWPGHENQWHGSDQSFRGREADVAQLYSTPDAETARVIIRKYGIDYVIAGKRELQKYPEFKMEKFELVGEVFFRQGDFVIYRVSEAGIGN